MTRPHPAGCTAFEGSRRIASGPLLEVAEAVKQAVDRGGPEPVLVFDNETSHVVELDLRGTVADVRRRVREAAPPEKPSESAAVERRGPGRPRLGVVSREVTLLPRHWDWLNAQPGGASAALRRLVEAARKANEGWDRVRQSRESAYRFMSAMAGNERGYEEACRALFAGQRERFHQLTTLWPFDVAEHARQLAEPGFQTPDSVKMPA